MSTDFKYQYMQQFIKFPFRTFTICSFIALTGCAGSKLGYTTSDEVCKMKVTETTDVVNFAALKNQSAPSLAMRGVKGRGILTSATGSLLSLATNAIKKVIADDQKKYTADYAFAVTDHYFYDQLSNEGPFDPVGLQFNGFRLVRTFTNSEGKTDTAFTANFVLDTANAYEILNNSVFRLRLESFNLKYAKAKIASGGDKKLNMDIDITFKTSYVNQEGVLFDNVTLGKFYLLIRDAPLDPSKAGYKEYYDGLKGTLLTGKSFLVPRSFGYHVEDGEPKPGYSQGAYSIKVNVKESSKNSFVSKTLMDNISIVDQGGKSLQHIINQKIPKKLQ